MVCPTPSCSAAQSREDRLWGLGCKVYVVEGSGLQGSRFRVVTWFRGQKVKGSIQL